MKKNYRGGIHLKPLMKSANDKALFGVCGGIAEFAGISSFLVRLIFILTAPASFWVYLVLNLGLKEKRTL